MSFTLDQMEVNWFHVVAALSRHRDTVSTERGGEVNIASMAPYFESRQGESQNSLIEKLISEVSAIRSQPIQVNIHTTNHSTSQSTATVHSTINASLSVIHQQMPPIEDGLVRIVRALEDFRDLEVARVESNEIAAMSRELVRMQEDISTLLSLRDDEVEAHARRSTTLERIKEGWGRLTSTAEVINKSPKVVEAFQRVRVLMAEVGEWIQNLPGL